MVSEGFAHPADVHVDCRVRQGRTQRNLSLDELGSLIGVDAWHIEAYETAAATIPTRHLSQIATVFGVSPAWFFEGLPARRL